jgi:hypothetical protein
MRYFLALLCGVLMLGGCVGSTPSDSDQQAMVKEWSSEKVAEAYEKAGKHAEAEEVRRNAKRQEQ